MQQEKPPRWLAVGAGIGLVGSALLCPFAGNRFARAEAEKPAAAATAISPNSKAKTNATSSENSVATQETVKAAVGRDGSGVAAKDTYTVKVCKDNLVWLQLF